MNIEEGYGLLLQIGLLARDCMEIDSKQYREDRRVGSRTKDMLDNSTLYAPQVLASLANYAEQHVKTYHIPLVEARESDLDELQLPDDLPPIPAPRDALRQLAGPRSGQDVRRKEAHARYLKGVEQRAINKAARKASRAVRPPNGSQGSR